MSFDVIAHFGAFRTTPNYGIWFFGLFPTLENRLVQKLERRGFQMKTTPF